MTQVVAALIWDRDRFLACQRPVHKARGSLWEFVGGKTEPGETMQQALIRECREELDIQIGVGEVFMEVIHEYPDLTVKLTLFHAWIEAGTPKLLEHQAIRWITTAQIDDYAFCPADEVILDALKQVSNSVQARLYACRDDSYQRFQCKLMPTVPAEKVLGVRMPALRQLSQNLRSSERDMLFHTLPHRYYEENNLHGLLINALSAYEDAVRALDDFLPWVDNWATCDLLSPKAFRSRPKALPDKIRLWLCSDHEYTVRFAIGVLLKYYLEDGFQAEYLHWVGSVRSDAYYVNMMIAWYFATALAKQYDDTLPWFQEGRLPAQIHNMSIQKALESHRIPSALKPVLKSYKRRGISL